MEGPRVVCLRLAHLVWQLSVTGNIHVRTKVCVVIRGCLHISFRYPKKRKRKEEDRRVVKKTEKTKRLEAIVLFCWDRNTITIIFHERGTRGAANRFITV